MSGAWDDVREAIAAKLAASSGCAAAGLRRATADADIPLLMLPEIRVLQPTMAPSPGRDLRPNANQETYRLTIPAELLVKVSAGVRRSDPVAAAIARAVQIEWRSGIKLGATVDDSWLEDWDDDLVEFGDTSYVGGRFTFVVDVTEYLATARTA